MKRVLDILKEPSHHGVFSVSPQQSILSAAQYMRAKNVGAVAVLKNDALVGILSERDLLKNVLGPGYDPRDVFVEQVMSQGVTTVSMDDTWEECLTKMRNTHCRHLPVLEDGFLVGMISVRDVLGPDESALLDDYSWQPSH